MTPRMSVWPFSHKDKDPAPTPSEADTKAFPEFRTNGGYEFDSTAYIDTEEEGTDTGPFDGATVDIEEFDFSDFSQGILNLGSLKLPLPTESQVQVEMGEQGPRMLHVVTRFGRITPVAFAAPKSSGHWRQAVSELVEEMRGDGLTPAVEDGPWGREIVAEGSAGTMRLIGTDGPAGSRWMLRFTLAGPNELAHDLTDLGREVFARTFVYRGDAAILAGSSLPVALPKQLVDQMNQALAQRAKTQK